GLVSHEPSVVADHRQAVRVAHGIAARDLDVFVADAPDQRYVGTDRDGDAGTDEAVDHALVELGHALPGVYFAEPDADGQYPVQPRAGACISHVGRALVEDVDRLRPRCECQHVRLLEPGVAEAIMALDLDVSRRGVDRRPGVDRVDLARVVVVAGRPADRGEAIPLHARLRGERTGLELQSLGNHEAGAGQAAERIPVEIAVFPAESALVAQRDRRRAVPARDARVHSGRDAGVGHRVVKRFELGSEHLRSFDVGDDLRAAPGTLDAVGIFAVQLARPGVLGIR